MNTLKRTQNQIVTVDDKFSIVEAAAVKDGRFVAVGSKADVLRRAGADARLGQLQDHRRDPADRQRHRIGMHAPRHGVRPEQPRVARRLAPTTPAFPVAPAA